MNFAPSVTEKGRASRAILIGTSLQDRPVQRHFVALACELANSGYQVGLIAHGPVDKTIHIDPRVSVLHWPSARPTKVVDMLFFDRLMRRFKPCCLISNFGATAIMMTIGALRRVPVRMFWHHTLSSQIDTDWKGSRFGLRWLRLRIRIPFGLATHAVANSGSAKRDLVDTYRVRPSKCTVFWNSLRDPLQGANSTPSVCNDARFACVGRLDPSKGQDVLLKAMAQVVSRHPKASVEFIGGGTAKDSLEDLSHQMGLQDRCRFLGPLPHPIVLSKMGRALAVVVPSREEAFGLVNIESMAVGVPVIGSNTGGIAEIVRDGLDGFLFPPGDHGALAKRMIELIENKPRRQQMAASARLRFLEFFESARAVKTQAAWIGERIKEATNGCGQLTNGSSLP